VREKSEKALGKDTRSVLSKSKRNRHAEILCKSSRRSTRRKQKTQDLGYQVASMISSPPPLGHYYIQTFNIQKFRATISVGFNNQGTVAMLAVYILNVWIFENFKLVKSSH